MTEREQTDRHVLAEKGALLTHHETECLLGDTLLLLTLSQVFDWRWVHERYTSLHVKRIHC